MMIINLNFLLFKCLVELGIFVLKYKYLLMMLMELEFMMLLLYLLMLYVLSSYIDYYFRLVFISMMVFKGVKCFSTLVLMVRSYGNDFFESMNILW